MTFTQKSRVPTCSPFNSASIGIGVGGGRSTSSGSNCPSKPVVPRYNSQHQALTDDDNADSRTANHGGDLPRHRDGPYGPTAPSRHPAAHRPHRNGAGEPSSAASGGGAAQRGLGSVRPLLVPEHHQWVPRRCAPAEGRVLMEKCAARIAAARIRVRVGRSVNQNRGNGSPERIRQQQYNNQLLENILRWGDSR